MRSRSLARSALCQEFAQFRFAAAGLFALRKGLGRRSSDHTFGQHQKVAQKATSYVRVVVRAGRSTINAKHRASVVSRHVARMRRACPACKTHWAGCAQRVRRTLTRRASAALHNTCALNTRLLGRRGAVQRSPRDRRQCACLRSWRDIQCESLGPVAYKLSDNWFHHIRTLLSLAMGGG